MLPTFALTGFQRLKQGGLELYLGTYVHLSTESFSIVIQHMVNEI